MDRRTDGAGGGGRRLLVALLVVAMSGALSSRPAETVGAGAYALLPAAAPAGLAPRDTPGAATWTQQQEVTATDGMANNYFGLSVALSGTAALISAPYWPNSTGEGALYAFARRSGIWSQQQEITDPCPCAQYDDFGIALALSGNTLLVGAPGKNGGVFGAGAVYVFTRSGVSWSQQAVLTATDGGGGDAFGNEVALSGDTALIWAPGRASNRGVAYLFVRQGTTWTQQAEVFPSDGVSEDHFGLTVALEGNTALIGAEGRHRYRGAVYVFTRGGTTWSQQAELAARDGAPGDAFGNSVALRRGTALIGAWNKNSGAGAAYVFRGSGASWVQARELTPSDSAPFDQFGNAVTLGPGTALIGAANKNGVGAAYVFAGAGALWSQQAELTASDGGGPDQFGSAVALDGGTALIGASYMHLTGAAYMFVRSGTANGDPSDTPGAEGQPAPYGRVR